MAVCGDDPPFVWLDYPEGPGRPARPHTRADRFGKQDSIVHVHGRRHEREQRDWSGPKLRQLRSAVWSGPAGATIQFIDLNHNNVVRWQMTLTTNFTGGTFTVTGL